MNRIQANFLLLLTAVIWGSTFVVQQVSTGGLDEIMFTSCRFFLGALVVFPFAVSQYKRNLKKERTLSRQDIFGMILTGLALFSGAVLQQRGIFYTSVTNAGFLTALYVPLVPFIAFFFLRTKIHWSIWPASLSCLLGTYIMNGAGAFHLSAGDLWVIASALFWAIHVLLVGYMATKTQAPLVVALVQFLTVGLVGLIVGIAIEQPQLADFSGATFGILYAGCISVGTGFTLQVVAQRYSPAADSAIILSSETVFAAICAFIFLQDTFTLSQITGAALIFLGILAVQLIPPRSESTKQRN